MQITHFYCSLCGDAFTSPKKSVIVRHVMEQHSGYGFRCLGCSRLFGRGGQEHTGCKYPEGDQVVLVERVSGRSGGDVEQSYEAYKDSVNSKISEKLAPPPAPKRARSLSAGPSESGSRKRARSVRNYRSASVNQKSARRSYSVVATAPAPAVVTSPVARVAPPPPPTFASAGSHGPKLTSATVDTQVTSRSVEPQGQSTKATPAYVEEVSTETLTVTVNPEETASNTGSFASSTRTAVPEEGEVHSSSRSGCSGGISITVDPSESIEPRSLMPPPPPPPTTTRTDRSVFQRLNPPLSTSVVGAPAALTLTDGTQEQIRRDVKLASWSDCQRQRIVLDVGGTRFPTSIPTLQSDPGSLLCAMVEPGSVMRPWRMDEHNCPVYFLDRDPAHFRLILNYLRPERQSNLALPREIKYLYEIRTEAEHYELSGLVEKVDRRIAIMNEAKCDPIS